MSEGRWRDDERRRYRGEEDRDQGAYGSGGDYGRGDRGGYSEGYDPEDHGGNYDPSFGRSPRAFSRYSGDEDRAYGGGGREDYGGGDYGRGGAPAERGYTGYGNSGGYGTSGRSDPDQRGDRRGREGADGGDRGWFARARDEVGSWFGGDDGGPERSHRGRGPRGYARSDDRIREEVCDALTEDHYVDASDIDVSVSGGEVTLGGTVDSRQAKRRAEDCAERVSGVRDVHNGLRVKERQDAGRGSGMMPGVGAPTEGGTQGASSAVGDGSLRRASGGASGSVSDKPTAAGGEGPSEGSGAMGNASGPSRTDTAPSTGVTGASSTD